jgi:hypothetical protein
VNSYIDAVLNVVSSVLSDVDKLLLLLLLLLL